MNKPLPFLSDRLVLSCKLVCALAMSAALLFYIVTSIHWPLLVDSPVMHYVVFLMHHGLQPYRDISDNNMPGAYLSESFAMAVFGGGDLGWRMYDFALQALLLTSMIVITWPEDWFAGFMAAGWTTLRISFHGPAVLGQRDELIMTLLMTGCAFLFSSVRRQRPWLAFGFGAVVAYAASIKPTFGLFAVLECVLLFFALRRRKIAPLAYLGWAVGGMFLAAGINLGFLFWYHAFGAFNFILRVVTHSYVSMARYSFSTLLMLSVTREMRWMFPFVVLALVFNRRWNWERTTLILGAAVGLFSYLIQQKGFPQHLLTYVAFTLLFFSIEIVGLLRNPGWPRLIGFAGLILPLFVLPSFVRRLEATPATTLLTRTLEADLRQLGEQRGPDSLQREVECFDLTFGCLNALYHLQLIQNTGYTGDMLLFLPHPDPAADFYRAKFWTMEHAHPASVFVVTDQSLGEENSYDRLVRWPEFSAYLASNYTLSLVRSFPRENQYTYQVDDPHPRSYRIYLRNADAQIPPAR